MPPVNSEVLVHLKNFESPGWYKKRLYKNNSLYIYIDIIDNDDENVPKSIHIFD